MCVYPESGCNNYKYLLKFRRGAFISEKPVCPVAVDYNTSMVQWDYGCINNFDMLTLFLSYGTFTHYLNHFQVFQPNEYLFETHADKGKERWEIYAWAIRDIIANASKLEKSEV